MADDMDRVQAVNEWWQEECLAEHRRRKESGVRSKEQNLTPHSSPLTVCEDCGEEIPEKRRRAVPGCRRCIDCQEKLENRRPL
jgi:phage/conjugal plasmid C-4 type zinc finger TraR family protein